MTKGGREESLTEPGNEVGTRIGERSYSSTTDDLLDFAQKN